MKKPDLQTLRQAIKDFTTESPRGMSLNEMVDLLVDQMAEMRREPENQASLKQLLHDACGTCNELFFDNGKAYRCNVLCYSTHSHQDFSMQELVKSGDARIVEVTPQNVLQQMEEFFHLNKQADRKDWMPYICKALGKPYKKSNYKN